MPPAARISVVIVEDDEEMSFSLVEILEAASDIEVVATFSTAEEAIREIQHSVPHVVMMDLRLPGMSGVDCVRRIKEKHPAIHIMMFTAFEDDDALFKSLTAGASGYLLKRSKPSAVIEAVRDLSSGGSPMSPGIARKLVRFFQQTRPVAPSSGGDAEKLLLSSRELEVLRMLSDGLRDKEIAEKLKLSIATVRTYLGRIYEKLHVTSRTEAVLKYLKADA